ncbi:MAG: hypothetical protein JW741_09680 [Sedimentisphaerales bacterium]|nr:hypothetical protein [Sedimentisphaerales bacterium]
MERRTVLRMAWIVLATWLVGTGAVVQAGPYAPWRHGLADDPNFFPIAVWLQNPTRAQRYKEAGINLYIGLWKGPTAEQLKQLKQAGMPVICRQNEVGLAHRDDPIIVGWMHGDEPDNAQSLGSGKGYGPPIPPQRIVAGYERMKAADPSRPVVLNLGQGVAWDGWHGRGVRTNHPEDYPEYVQGCDIASFDIYPAAHSNAQVAGKLWYVAQGVERLVKWTQGKKIVWNCIECTRINNPTQKATPHQVRCEVWMSLIHGSTGLIYFVHEWQPRFNESALLSDAEMCAAVTRINRQIAELAPVLNTPTVPGGVTVTSGNREVPVAAMVKRYGGSTYVFAVAMREGVTQAGFRVAGVPGRGAVEVLGETRRIASREGVFQDEFKLWDVHLYRLGSEGER